MKNLFRTLALSTVVLLGSTVMYVRADGDDDPGTEPFQTSVDFLLQENPYNLTNDSSGYIRSGTLMKQGPISAVYVNSRVAVGSFYGPSGDQNGGTIIFIPNAGYKITSVQFINTSNGKDLTSSFQADGYTYTKTTSGSASIGKITVEYEADPETNVDNMEVADAFTEAISETARKAYPCLSKFSSFVGQDARNLVFTALPAALMNFRTESANFSSVEAVNEYFAAKYDEFYALIQADLTTTLANPDKIFSFQSQGLIDAGRAAGSSYLSGTLDAIDCPGAAYIANSFSLASYFSLVSTGEDTGAYNLNSFITGLNMASASAGDGLIGPKSADMPDELAVKVVMNGNNVQLVLADNASKAVGVDSETGRLKVLDTTDATTIMNIFVRNSSDALSSASSTFSNWRNASPNFTSDELTEFQNRVKGAESLEAARAIIREVQQFIIAKFSEGEVNMSFTGLSGKFIGDVDGVWKTDIPAADAQRWLVTFDPTETSYNKVTLFDKTAGKYLVADGTMTEEADQAGAFAFVFDPTYLASIVVPGKTENNCLTTNTTDYELQIGNYCDRATGSITLYVFKFVYDPSPIAEVVTVLTEGLEQAEQLGQLYLKSIPFAGKTARDIVTKIGTSLDNIDPVAAPIRSIEAANEYVENQINSLESALLADLNANIGKELVLWQPGQKGYLSALTRDPGNKGFEVFDYQAKINADAAWTPVADTADGAANQFFMKSAKGQFISTPNVNYVRVADEQPTSPDGAFTFGLKDGYVTFNSVNHAGCALGFDCQNDPVEIMTLTDGSKGYRWQVSLMETYQHEYVTFKSKRWGKYLQDANEPVTVNSYSSTLCSSADVTANAIWELLKGTADGAYHIRNFATGKYLVNLVSNNSQVVDNPVNIWLNSYPAYAEEGGVTISTSSTAAYNCLDADNNGILAGLWQPDGGTGTCWFATPVSEETVRADFGNVYVTFTSNLKEWGTYLQDAFQPLSGTSGTLCSVDSICQNAIWQLTPGTSEGSYHVQNFATKRYLVELNANGSKTVAEPVDIWFPEFTIGGNSGVQISIADNAADANSLECTAGNKTVGCGANTAGSLWIKDQLDEYTAAQIASMYPAADRAIALAIEEQARKFRVDCESYLESLPCGEDIINEAITKLDGIIANSDEVAKDFKRLAFLEPYFMELKASYETPLLEELNEMAADGTIFSLQINYLANGAGYYSSSLYAVDGDNAALMATTDVCAGNLFYFEENGNDFNLYSLNCGRIYGSNATGTKIGTFNDGWFKTEVPFRLTLQDGFARLNVVNGTTVSPVGIFTQRPVLGTYSANAATFGLKLKTYTLEEAAEMANTQLTLWGSLMPGGVNIVGSATPQVTAANSAAAINQIMIDTKKAMIEALVNCENDVYIKSINTDGFLGFDGAWYSNFNEDEASAWKFTSPEGATLTGVYSNSFLMMDETAGGVYMTYRGGNSTDPKTTMDGTPDYLAIVFDNPGIITITIPRNYMANALTASGESISFPTFGDRYTAESIAPYCFGFMVKGGTVGIEDLTIDDSNTVFYDLMGNRVVNPGKGIYVKVTGGKSQKVIIK